MAAPLAGRGGISGHSAPQGALNPVRGHVRLPSKFRLENLNRKGPGKAFPGGGLGAGPQAGVSLFFLRITGYPQLTLFVCVAGQSA